MESHCPLCGREDVRLRMERHHLRTRRADRDLIERICHLCHKTIHSLWTNKELADPACDLDSIEGLLRDARFVKAVRFNARVTPGRNPRQRTSRHKRDRR